MPDSELEQIKSETDKVISNSEKSTVATKHIGKQLAEIKELVKNPALGINNETMMAFIGNRTWKLNEQGHIKSIRNEIKTHYLELIKIITNQKTQIEALENIDKIDELSKLILVLGLDSTFDYDAAAEDTDIGPGQLRYLAQEIGHFLVVQGGRGASKHLQLLLKLNQMTQSEN